MRRLLILVLILVLGAAVLAPVIGMAGLDPLPGDFTIIWSQQYYPVPVVYSLCASCLLALFYYIMKR